MMREMIFFTGGELATNGYLVPVEEGKYLCFDAPEGMANFIAQKGYKIAALILTHGHFDHIWDAARIEKEQGCPVYAHAGDAGMIRDPGIFKLFGVQQPIAPVKNLKLIPVPEKGKEEFSVGKEKFQAFHIPGHSLGSVAFYHPGWKLIMGGDILFAGGVGRWDLPGGSRDSLLSGIKNHLLKLPVETEVFPGHGGSTTIGAEKETNPYLE